MEWKQLTDRTAVFCGSTNVGVYFLNEREVVLIDAFGVTSDATQALTELEQKGLRLHAIINTHCHADHIAGNAYLQEQTGCAIYADEKEAWWINHPEYGPAFDFGGFPFREINNRVFLAAPSRCQTVDQASFDGLTAIPLPGHAGGHMGVMTDDGVFFVGDALCGEKTITVCRLTYNYDIAALKRSFDVIEQTPAEWVVASHHEPVQDVGHLLAVNRENIEEIDAMLLALCETPRSIDELIAMVTKQCSVSFNSSQYVIYGTTIRNHLSYLRNARQVRPHADGNYLRWQTVIAKA